MRAILAACAALALGAAGVWAASPSGPCCSSVGYRDMTGPIWPQDPDKWSVDQAARFLRIHPGWYVFLPTYNSATVRQDDAGFDGGGTSDAGATEIHGLQDAMVDPRVCITFRYESYRPVSGFSTEQLSTGDSFQDSYYLTISQSTHNTNLGRFSSFGCSASLDLAAVEPLFYTDSGASDLCSGDAADVGGEVPLLYGGVSGNTFNTTRIALDVRNADAMEWMAQKAIDKLVEYGDRSDPKDFDLGDAGEEAPACIRVQTKSGYWQPELGGNTQDPCGSSASNSWSGPAHATGDATYDPDGDCENGHAGPVAPNPYTGQEFERGTARFFSDLLRKLDADSAFDGVKIVLTERPASRTTWEAIPAVLRRSARLLGEWRNGGIDDPFRNDFPNGAYTGPYETSSSSVQLNHNCTDTDTPKDLLTHKWDVAAASGESCSGTWQSSGGTSATTADPILESLSNGDVCEVTYTCNDGTQDDPSPDVETLTQTTAANSAPTADAGGPYSGDEDTAIAISGSCPDDGLPDPPGAVTSKWTANDCTGTVTFGDANALSTTITVADPQSCSPQLTCCDNGEAACQ